MSDKLTLKNEMKALDLKDREFYDSLDDQERKKFSTFLMMKYAANVGGSKDMQDWYLLAHNERVNINFFDIPGVHNKLKWLLCTTVSPGMGTQNHYWLNKKTVSKNPVAKFFGNLYPHLSDSELELMSQINSIEQVRKLARDMGWDDKRINDEL